MTRTSGSGVVELLSGTLPSAVASTPAALGTNGAALWIAGPNQLRG
jgi:hypothetical protein